jgi:hypothetical protein
MEKVFNAGMGNQRLVSQGTFTCAFHCISNNSHNPAEMKKRKWHCDQLQL